MILQICLYLFQIKTFQDSFLQEECWWNCMIISDRLVNGQAIANPECLKDCFLKTKRRKNQNGKRGRRNEVRDRQRSDSDSSCFASLIGDVTSKGTCDTALNPASQLNIWGWNELGNDCSWSDGPRTEIAKGTCSKDTEERLNTTSCLKFLAEQPKIVKNTLQLLVRHSCSADLYNSLPFSANQLNTG